jgi:hypothetical protein
MEILIALLIGILANYTFAEFNNWRKSKIEYRSTLTGNWTQMIYEDISTKIRAIDDVKCRHNNKTNQITGDISRFEPSAEGYKKWKFSGQFRQDTIYLTFWSVSDKNPSNGTIIMNFDEGKKEFVGQYVKAFSSVNTNSVVRKLVQNNIVWKEKNTSSSNT